MARIKKADLDRLAAHIEKLTGVDHAVSWAYGAPRLESNGGGRDVSPRLPSGQLYLWMHAYIDGIDAARRPESIRVPGAGRPPKMNPGSGGGYRWKFDNRVFSTVADLRTAAIEILEGAQEKFGLDLVYNRQGHAVKELKVDVKVQAH